MPIIKHIVMMGDSLSDRGTMDKRKLLGLIPMSLLSGLSGISPEGRFTNGYTWSDHLAAKIADEFILQTLRNEQKEKQLSPLDVSADIADEIIAHDPAVRKNEESFHLNNDKYVRYKGQDFVRSYDEGGLTAHDYAGKPSWSIKRFFSRLILSTLSLKRKLLLGFDKAHKVTDEHKAETLVMEWSGANDLITVNAHPSEKEVEEAIKARIENVREMIKHGYKHFMLFDLPDLSLTPRYHNKGGWEERNAHEMSTLFNTRLADEVATLKSEYRDDKSFQFDVFEVSVLFTELYDDPASEQFVDAKKHEPYIKSDAFKRSKDHAKDCQGHMFWDDVHPTAHLHRVLADRVYDKLTGHGTTFDYHFEAPRQETTGDEIIIIPAEYLVESFKAHYMQTITHQRNSLFGHFRRYNININSEALSLDDILEHAVYQKGNRTLNILEKMGWMDNTTSSKVADVPALREAMERVTENHDRHAAHTK